jgi:hypothetical protein
MADTTRIGRPGQQSVVVVECGLDNFPGVLNLRTTDAGSGLAENNYLWFDSDGVLRTSQTFPADQDSDGVAVGIQG